MDLDSRNFLVAVLIAVGGVFAAGDYAAEYSWEFTGGNLLANWSFENYSEETCKSGSTSGTLTNCRAAVTDAKGGSFVLSVQTVNSTGTVYSQKTDLLPCEPNSSYKLSYFVNATWANRGASNFPAIRFFGGDRASSRSDIFGPSYESSYPQNTGGWKMYSFEFTTGPADNFLSITFLQCGASTTNFGNKFLFDNVLLQPKGAEEGVSETRTYGDASGRTDETVFSDGSLDRVSFLEYDGRSRLARSYSPITVAQGLPVDLSAVTVGARSTGETLEYDFADLQSAYAGIKARVAGMKKASLANLAINVVVNSPGELAPLSGEAAQFSSLPDIDFALVPFKFIGIIKYSTDYNTLAAKHGSTAAANPGKYSFADFQARQSTQYPGEASLFGEVKYLDDGETSAQSSIPGAGYELNASTPHVSSNGWFFTGSTTILPSPEYPAVPGATGLAPYIYRWAKDRQGSFQLSWFNDKNQLVKSATGGPAKWAVTTYDYDGFGRLLGANTPQGMYADKEYNGNSQIIASIDPDRGRIEYMYDKRGAVRFIHPTEAAASYMIANKYDVSGRLVETGRTAYNWNQTAADNFSGYPTEWLDVGHFYDDLHPTDFQLKTGVSLSTIGLDPAKLKNTQGRLAASYNRNSEVTAPGITTADRKLVANFFSYDDKGRLSYSYKYLGPNEKAADRLQKTKYVFDANDRLESQIVFKGYSSDENSSIPSSRTDYVYDETGRMVYALDKDAKVMAEYVYNSLGSVASVLLYGKFQVTYKYDIRGSLVKSEVTKIGIAPEYVFSEEIGYHSKPNPYPTVPALAASQARWDGKASSILRKFSKDVASPVNMDIFDFDVLGNLIKSQRKLSDNTPLYSDGGINFPGLYFPTTEAETFSYSTDGSLLSRQTSSATYNYEYRTNNGPTHQVQNMSPGLRSTGEPMWTSTGNFQYDLRGRLTADAGLGKTITYGFTSDKPVKVAMPGRNYHMFYDAGYSRVAEFEERSGAIVGLKVYVLESGIAKQYLQRTSSHPLGAFDMVKNQLQGPGGLIGEEFEGTGQRKLYITDRLGSVVKAIDEPTSQFRGEDEYSYSAYGIMKKLVSPQGTLKATGTYTGKEYSEDLKSYDFGARWYDADLAKWSGPDAAAQYNDPYAKGADPVNYVDPDGNCDVYMAGVQGGAKNPFGNQNTAGREIGSTGYNIIENSTIGQLADITVVAYNDPGSYSSTVSDMRRLKKGCDETTVYAHSGGGNRILQASIFHPSARADKIEFYASPVTPGGKTLLRFMGTKTGDPNYGVKDPVSWLAAVQDWADPDPVIASVFNGEMSPWILATGSPTLLSMPNPVNKLRVLNPYNWYLADHTTVKEPDRYSVGEWAEDHPWTTAGIFILSGGPQNTMTSIYATGFALGMTVDFLQHTLALGLGPISFTAQDVFDHGNDYDPTGESIERGLGWALGARPLKLGLDYLFK